MTHHDEETGALQVHVGIDVNKRIAAQFHTRLDILLYGKLADLRQIVGRVVFGEEGGIGTQFYCFTTRNLKKRLVKILTVGTGSTSLLLEF